MKDLNALLIFTKVVEASSFSEAARRLKMPISTVSRRISELENQLGVRLLERSTHHLRLTDLGAEVFEFARHTAEVSEAVDNVISNRLPEVSGVLRLCAPPSISDSLVVPVVGAFQQAYPKVRVQAFVTERIVDQIAEDVDIALKVGTFTDPTLDARKLLTYRHQLVASPAYLARCEAPQTPRDLLQHRLFAFSFWRPDYSWRFVHANGLDTETLSFQPAIAMNDYTGIVVALLEGDGIGELPPIVQPELMRKGLLVEVMPDWHLPVFDLTIANLRDRYLPRQVRIFRDFAAQMVPGLFASLPAGFIPADPEIAKAPSEWRNP
ncbi:MAG: LysR family transcriptional regulator [Pseudomonadota bacterium]|jgi:DNA-binding transcriptional LysR family regulator|uniref:LysR family transcriptional regulator n=1 Tax=Burkholderiaceae TaxID=119060 RepID=UPI0010F5077B|nr:LysR family transcriptional regulator [Burkholderia sp. 4M9327F10]